MTVDVSLIMVIELSKKEGRKLFEETKGKILASEITRICLPKKKEYEVQGVFDDALLFCSKNVEIAFYVDSLGGRIKIDKRVQNSKKKSFFAQPSRVYEVIKDLHPSLYIKDIKCFYDKELHGYSYCDKIIIETTDKTYELKNSQDSMKVMELTSE